MAQAIHAKGLAAQDSTGVLLPFEFNLREPSDTDVLIRVLYCGIDHTDLHFIRNDFGTSTYPLVPGHEVSGVVTRVGPQVTKFQVGDHVGVGCYVDSCGICEACIKGFENYCDKCVTTYNGLLPDGTHTFGGYATFMVVKQDYVLRIPRSLSLDVATPLLCAGITVFSAMKRYGMTEAGKSFGVVGLGGLGHLAVKFGKAFSMKVTVISTSQAKEKDARELLGADQFVVSTDPEQMKAAEKSLDFILDTVSAQHSLQALLLLLRTQGKLILVGAPEKPLELPASTLLLGGKTVGGSYSGGMAKTQEMLDFCATHNVTASIEKVGLEFVNGAIQRLQKMNVKYRFVIDVAGSSQKPPTQETP